ncbi:MAG: response regulator [bacterium]
MNNQYDILIIDDEKVIIDSIQKITGFSDFTSDTAFDALTAIQKILENNYRLIICDIMMPGMDGFQFLKETFRLGITAPVIMTTGYSTLDNAVKALIEGAFAYIPKPFSIDEMTSAIKRGIKFSGIQNKLRVETGEVDSTIHFVPCPATYCRLGYSSWVFLDKEGMAVLGVHDFFIRTIDIPDQIEFMEIGDNIEQGNICAKIISVDSSVHNLLSPVSGKIIERNEKLLKDISLLEKDPYFEGWIYRVVPTNSTHEIKNLIPCSSDRL